MRIVILLVILLVFNTAVYSQVYKWIDQDGKTQYGDQPSIDSDTSQVKINSGSGTLQTSAGEDDTTLDLAEALKKQKIKRETIENEIAMKQTEAKANKKKCTDAQTRLKMLQEMPHLSLPDGEGGFRNVEDIKRKAMTEETKMDIAVLCK